MRRGLRDEILVPTGLAVVAALPLVSCGGGDGREAPVEKATAEDRGLENVVGVEKQAAIAALIQKRQGGE